MKILEWQNFFAEQQTAHGKVVFSVAELANAARTSLHGVNTELGRLLQRGIVKRYAQGRYGLAKGVEVEDILPAIDRGAYLTGFYVLFHQNIVTQVPTEITCFTDRRHNRKKNRLTAADALHFICVPPPVYSKPSGGIMASAEQALCDFVWMNLRDGLDAQSLVTFKNLESLKGRGLQKALRRYPGSVRAGIAAITGAAMHRRVD